MTARALMIGAALGLGALGADLPALAAPDAMRGGAIYARCLACHALAFDHVGPRHCGLLGRRAGSVPGFEYSPAMKQSLIIWDAKALDRFLAAPTKVMPGTAMTYDGVPDRGSRTFRADWCALA
jgi:cytochrome c